MDQQHARRIYPHYRGQKKYFWRCHYYGIHGHIRPYYYRLYGYPQHYSQARLVRKIGKSIHARKLWKPKETTISLIAQTSIGFSSRED